MNNQSKKILDTNITKLVNQPYKYGFSTTIEKDIIEKGLNENIIRLISKKKDERSMFDASKKTIIYCTATSQIFFENTF